MHNKERRKSIEERNYAVFSIYVIGQGSTLFITTRRTRHILNARHIGLALCCGKELG